MPMPEEVDEINEYLKARRQKQELGELPKPDLTPSFVKRMSGALFGVKAKPKVPLQSMQPTFVSPQAQSAVRKQLDEIMRERSPTQAPLPPARMAPSTPARPAALPTIPKYPDAAAWKAPVKPTAASLPPRPVLNAAPKPAVNVQPSKPASTGWGFWNKPKPASTTPAPTRVSAPAPTAATRPLPPRPVASAPAPPSAVPLSTPARTASSVQPYADIPALSTNVSNEKSFAPIQGVTTPKSTSSTIPPVSAAPLPFVPAAATPAVAAPPARTPYAPPWVTRNIPKPGISPSLSTSIQSRATTPSAVPLPVSKKEVVAQPVQPNVEQLAAPRAPVSKPWVTGTLPVEAREEFKSTIQPARVESKPSVQSFSSSPSGEVHVDELARSTRKSEVQPTPPMDAALHEEISEEEAIDKLPFEEVEGLSESDLAYLERKEQEHAQTHDEELDQSDPAALKAGLENQTQKLGATSPTPSESDPKQEILRRLKKMMEDEHQSPRN